MPSVILVCLSVCLFVYVVVSRRGLVLRQEDCLRTGCTPNALLCKEAVSSFPAPSTQVQKGGQLGVQPEEPASAPPSFVGKQADHMGTFGSEAPFFKSLKAATGTAPWSVTWQDSLRQGDVYPSNPSASSRNTANPNKT